MPRKLSDTSITGAAVTVDNIKQAGTKENLCHTWADKAVQSHGYTQDTR